MRAVVQRVTAASVTVGGEQVSSIGRGLCVLLGISVDDTQKDAEYMVRKILNLRLFDDENGRAWSKSVMERGFEVLCVSQFTLQYILKGNKPDFHAAMPAELAQPFYCSILENMRTSYKPEMIKDGVFGAYMQLHIQNDGPVTIELTSPTGPADPRQVRCRPKHDTEHICSAAVCSLGWGEPGSGSRSSVGVGNKHHGSVLQPGSSEHHFPQ
uniref:D-aminoacyl-tRNA deacylase n=1 Tax=Nothobranchius furzeri TaxID=105023 RepID=A0A8C6KFY8_NOTFU